MSFYNKNNILLLSSFSEVYPPKKFFQNPPCSSFSSYDRSHASSEDKQIWDIPVRNVHKKKKRSRIHSKKWNVYLTVPFWNAFFLKKGHSLFWNVVLVSIIFPTRFIEEKQMMFTPDSSRDLFQYNLMNSIQRCAPIVRSSNCFQNIFF
jgi:hypothetical protein